MGDDEIAVESIKNDIENIRLEMWISEVIQNAIDAKWGSDHVLSIVVNLRQSEDGYSIIFRHNGRPPQHLDFGQNELLMMLSLGGIRLLIFHPLANSVSDSRFGR